QVVGGRQFVNAFERGARRGYVAVAQICVNRRRIDFARNALVGQQPLQLRGEEKMVAELRVEERLFTDAVSRQEESPPPPVPNSEGEHSAQLGQTIDTPLLVGADDRFRIRARAEAVAQALKLSAETLEVVDLAVEGDPYVAARVRHRLAARFGKVDDRKAAVPQRAAPVRPDAPGVRAAMSLGVDHRPQARLERSAGV